MAPNKIKILSTRPLEGDLLTEQQRSLFELETRSFIDTEPLLTVEVQQEVEWALQQETTVVFTSMNAVEAVAAFLQGEQPAWSIYCMGNTTLELVKKYFGEAAIADTASSAALLARAILDDGYTEELVFFCGDRRRDELPDILAAGGITVHEIMVYHTVATAHTLKKEYDGILFFSPSAADSFFSTNRLPAHTVLFAIGETTARTLKNYSSNTLITGDKPGKQYLLQKALQYFGRRKK